MSEELILAIIVIFSFPIYLIFTWVMYKKGYWKGVYETITEVNKAIDELGYTIKIKKKKENGSKK